MDADKRLEKLQKALKVDINEDAWANICITKRRPLPAPKSKKIAVKVISHDGTKFCVCLT
jgi:hypothetical protein